MNPALIAAILGQQIQEAAASLAQQQAPTAQPALSPLDALARTQGRQKPLEGAITMRGNAKTRDKAGRADGDPHPTNPGFFWSAALKQYVKR